MGKLKKVFKITFITITIFVVVVIAFISPLTKYLIEKFDKQYTGREITMDWAYVNPFTGYIHFEDLKIFEQESDTVFISINGISANLAMGKLLSKNYEISSLTLDQPKALVFQYKTYFNFNDLIRKFTSKGDTLKKLEPMHLSILDIKITDGTFYYQEIVTPINYFIKKVNIESIGYRWDVDTVPIKFSFLPGIGSGDIKGNFTVNSKNNDYKLAILIKKFDLNIIGQYVKDLTNYGSFKAFLDADFNSEGNLLIKENVTNSGLLSISDFHFGKDSTNDFAAFENLTISIKQVSPKRFKYLFDSISLQQPYFKYEKYDYLDNVQTMFGINGANVKSANAEGAKFNLVIEIAKYIKTISKNLLRSNYKIGRIAVYNGDILYNDFSLGEKFGIAMNPLNFIADSVEKVHKRVDFQLSAGIKPYGKFAVDVSINPKDSSDFDLFYHFQKIPVTIFNPYLIKYTSFPLDRGTLEVKGLWKVRNGHINSNNHLLVIDPRVGKKTRNKNAQWLPLRFAMFFVRERGNVIDYEVPILGDLNDPKFKIRDVIFDALENLFVKPATTAYRYEVDNIEIEIEKSLSLKWDMRNSLPTSSQVSFLERMADFLSKTPDATIIINPQHYELKEKEYILFYEGKKKYYLNLKGKDLHSFDKDDSIFVEKLSIKDPAFIRYLNANVKDSLEFTVQSKLLSLLGPKAIESKYRALNIERIARFMRFFKENGTENRVKIAVVENVIPYNGFSFYKISYKGDFPDYLLTAYHKMDELNNEGPRKKFRKARQKIGKGKSAKNY